MTRATRAGVLMLLCCAGSIPVASAVEVDWSLKLKVAGVAEGDRSLGTDPLGDATTGGYLDIHPAVRLQFTPDFASYVRVQGFLTSKDLVERDNGLVRSGDSYAALREAYLEYGGLTSYPGEVLRFGLQRVREPDGLWFDRDVESLRWIFDTTLLQAQVGVAEQFSTWRTNDDELDAEQKHRLYGFAGIGGQWFPGNTVGVRIAYAKGRDDLPEAGIVPDADTHAATRDLGWVGLRFENGYYAVDNPQVFSYWTEVVGMFGSQDEIVLDPLTGAVAGRRDRDAGALGGDLGLRFRVSQTFPLQIGLAYAMGQGGGDEQKDKTFRQTGLHSNRSRFTGTRTVIYRFSEALQADLQNLSDITAYLSLPLDAWDASLIAHSFRRDDAGEGIVASGIAVQPTTTSKSIGTGADLVVTRYFERRGDDYTPGEDVRANVRLRGSIFQPGDAFADDTDDQYRVVLETTWWF
jgi:alginate production protein